MCLCASFQQVHDKESPAISGRELHEALGIETPYSKWFPRMCEYGFEPQKDFSEVSDKNVQNPLGGRPATDHTLSLAMAKEIAMLQRNEKGKAVRKYLISIEEQWNNPEMVMSRALRMAEHNLLELKAKASALLEENAAMKPKAEHLDALVDRNSLLSLRDTAKVLAVPEREFIAMLFKKGYIYRDAYGKIRPYAGANTQCFEVKECYHGKWAGVQTMTTPRGRMKLLQIFKKEQAEQALDVERLI